MKFTNTIFFLEFFKQNLFKIEKIQITMAINMIHEMCFDNN